MPIHVATRVRAVCLERGTYGSEGGSLYWVPTLLAAELVTWKNGAHYYFAYHGKYIKEQDGQFID